MSNKQLIIRTAFGVGIAVIILFLMGFGWWLYQRYSSVVVKARTPGEIIRLINATPTPTPDPLAPYSVLLLGYGGPQHEGGYLTDTMIVAHIAPREKTVTLIALPRDLWVSLPLSADDGEVFYKINAAYAFGLDQRQYQDRPIQFTGAAGGGELAKHAAEYVTGLPVRYFIALSFDGFIKSIDVLDGVEVVVPHTFDDYYYPIEAEKDNVCGKSEEELVELTATLSGVLLEQEFHCRYEHVHFDRGKTYMNGETALKFVRSRKSDAYGGDYNRSIRQQALLQAVKDKIIRINFIPKVIPFINSLTADMQTDIDVKTIASILQTHPAPGEFTMHTVTLTEETVLATGVSNDGQYILEPKDSWESVHRFISDGIASASAKKAD